MDSGHLYLLSTNLKENGFTGETQEPFSLEISKDKLTKETNLLLMETGKETNGTPAELAQSTTNPLVKSSQPPASTTTQLISI